MNELFDYYKSREAFQSLKPKTKKQFEYVIRNRFLNYVCNRFTFGEMPGNSISVEEAQKWLDDVKNGTGKYKKIDPCTGRVSIVTYKPSRSMALQARRTVNRMFNVLDGKRLDRNPIAKTDQIEPPPKRTNKLTPTQIKVVWEASEYLRPSERDYVRFMLLTAQRLTQCARLRWEWVDWERNNIVFPGEEMKGRNGKTLPYLMPMSKPVRKLLQARFSTARGIYVFPSDRETPLSNSSRLIARLDALIAGGHYQWKNQSRSAPIKFCWHDFRRTASGLLQARHSVKRYQVKLLIAHKMNVSGDPIESYWDSGDQMEKEKRRLFDLLGQEIMACVIGIA